MICRECATHHYQGQSRCSRCGGELADPIEPKKKGFSGRPGTALASLIPAWAVSNSIGCGCKRYQLLMDGWGPEGCKERMDEIVDHLASQRRHLKKWIEDAAPHWVHRAVARQLVKRAIKMSEQDHEPAKQS